MTGEWRTRRVKRTCTGETVWAIYRLRDAAAADEPGNREYWPRDGCPAWAMRREGAEQMARNLNMLDKLRRRGGENHGRD